MRRWIGGALGVLALLALAGCASPAPGRSGGALCAPAEQRALACGLYVAVSAEQGGREQAWLPTSPIRLWFEPLNGARTAILDSPVNTYDVPTLSSGPVLWRSGTASGSDVGCVGGCDADGFAGRITDDTARYRESGGTITITAGSRRIVFAPTAAPDPTTAGCDGESIDEFACHHFVSVTGTAGSRRVDDLRTAPLRLDVSGTGAHRAAVIRDGSASVRIPFTLRYSTGTTTAGPAPTPSACAAAACGRLAVIAARFAAGASWRVDFSSLLASGDGWTMQFEAARG